MFPCVDSSDTTFTITSQFTNIYKKIKSSNKTDANLIWHFPRDNLISIWHPIGSLGPE
jgi:hypothetical protein